MSDRDIRPKPRTPESGAQPSAEDTSRIDLRETYRNQLVQSIGGWTGTVITALPTVVFVIVNAIVSLRPAVLAAVGTGVVLAGYRLARKQSTQQAVSGLFAVVIAAAIAARTGQARGYFLLGIWASFVYAVPFAVSMLVRRPLVGLLWEFLDPSPDDAGRPWYRRRRLLRGYTFATLIGTVLFLARGIVQAALYHHNATGWLSVAKIAMGTPLYIIAVAAAVWVVRRARHAEQARLAEQQPDGDATVAPDDAPGADPSVEPVAGTSAEASAEHGRPDRGLGLG